MTIRRLLVGVEGAICSITTRRRGCHGWNNAEPSGISFDALAELAKAKVAGAEIAASSAASAHLGDELHGLVDRLEV